MKVIKLILVLLISSLSFSQSFVIKDVKGYDTIIVNDAYKSFFNKELRSPLYVKYILYKGGGDCNRDKFTFKIDKNIKLKTAVEKDYSKTGYDRGHLANAEDFAYDCRLDSLTFFYYNCIPQSVNLNRGIWKVWEDSIRKKSQTDSLLIICGGKFKDVRIGNIGVPDNCFKIVYSLTTNKLLHVLWFTNMIVESGEKNPNKINVVREVSFDQLQIFLGYKLNLEY